MTEKKDKSELIKQRNEIKKEIADLKKQLNSINDEKESWFQKKESFQKDIDNKISNVKELKNKSDESNKSLFHEKDVRDRHNREVRKLIFQIKELNKQKREFLSKHNVKVNPLKIKEKIDQLEESVETQALSYDKEKKMMEQIKKLKKTYDETAQLNQIVEKADRLSKRIDEAKKRADSAHDKLQKFSENNKEGYGTFIEVSKEINKIKREKDKCHKKFIEHKKKFTGVNNQLKAQLITLNGIQDQLNGFRRAVEDEKKNKQKKLLAEKTKSVEEKLKNRKKLTTEDLLIFQGQ